ncbi:integral membrane protein [Neisseria meningitidis]|nr:integral membrane protein [Neisseria meningitidis]
MTKIRTRRRSRKNSMTKIRTRRRSRKGQGDEAAAVRRGNALLVFVNPLYYGREAGWFVWLAAAMCGLWLLRALTAKLPQQRYAALFITLFFAAVLVFGRHDSMYWYPVLVNLMMLAVFGGSLFAGQTVIERLARLQQPDLPEKAVRYTRRVTQVWCVFFIANGTLAALLARLGDMIGGRFIPA